MMDLHRTIHGSAHDIPLLDKSVQCIVTSPPYWGLRSYLGEQGVDWPAVTYQMNEWVEPTVIPAMSAPLGLEPDPVSYIGHLILCLREWGRVLRDDGTCWVNLGDSYAGSGGAHDPSHANDGISKSAYRSGFAGYVANDGRNKHKNTAGLKPKDLCGIPWLFAVAARADGWYLRSDIIWCLSGGTKVYAKTQKGEMPMTIKDMVRLDPSTVKLWNGEKWTQVLGWSETPRPDNPVEIELRSGERIGCTPNHAWPTQRGLIKAADLQVGDVIRSTQLPQPIRRKEPEHLPPSTGWFVGLYLAEGSRSEDTIQIASHINEDKRYEKLCRIADMYGGTCARHVTSDNGMTINLNGKLLNAIIDTYISGRVAKDKHLSMACWQRGNYFLSELWRGYLSGDGHWDKANERWRLGFTRNYNLAADMRTLVARIGGKLRIKLSHTGEFKTFRGEYRWEHSVHFNAKKDTEIMRIGRSRARKFWDIGVEDDPHLFALASGVLTHNSKPNPMPESCGDRPTKSHEYLFLLTKSRKYYYDSDAVREAAQYPFDNRGQRKDSRRDVPLANSMNGSTGSSRNRRSVWHIATQPTSYAHFATFPEKLVEPCIKAGTSARGCCPECGAPWERVVERGELVAAGERGKYEYNGEGKEESGLVQYTNRNSDGHMPGRAYENTTTGWQPTCDCDTFGGYQPQPCTVLDPFSGSGTSGIVALKLGRAYVGVDISEEYLSGVSQERMQRGAQIGMGV